MLATQWLDADATSVISIKKWLEKCYEKPEP